MSPDNVLKIGAVYAIMSAAETREDPVKHPEPKTNAPPDMSNILAHIKGLETTNSSLQSKLAHAEERNSRLSAKTRVGMQSALDSLMKKWMDAVDTKDAKVKEDFKEGLTKLVTNSAEDNGVWQMMVAASSLHERQEHNLDNLRKENNNLKLKVDGMFGESSARVVGGKASAEQQLSRADVEVVAVDMWGDFAKDIGSMY